MAPGRQRPLTDEEKEYMQRRRVEARKEKEDAIAMLENNPQFCKPSFWRSLDPDIVQDVQEAIRRSQKEQKKREIERLQKRIDELQGDL